MSTYEIPTAVLAPASQDWGLQSNTQVFRSKFTGAIQTKSIPGALWTCRYTYPIIADYQINAFKAFLVKLRGQGNRFYARDFGFLGNTNTGVTASGVTGSTSLQLSTSSVVGEGEYISLDNELKLVVDNVGTVLTVEPPLRNDYTAEAVELAQPACLMVLDINSVKWTTVSPLVSSLEFSGIEALT